ncbi:MAG: hypothetical protein JXB07_15205 [Anaerolineae bacterium]|nr:hypothetical protein [Anaerolineae bacterium]
MSDQQTLMMSIGSLVVMGIWIMIVMAVIDPLSRKLIGGILGVTITRQHGYRRKFTWHVEEAGRPFQAFIVQILFYVVYFSATVGMIGVVGVVLWQMGILNPNDIEAFLNS